MTTHSITNVTIAAPQHSTSSQYQEFLDAHGPHFTETVHLRAAIADPYQLNTWLIDAIRAITNAQDGTVRLRAFRGFTLDYQLTNHLATAIPTNHADAAAWLGDHGGRTACIALNQLAQWSLPLAQWYIDRVREIHSLGLHPNLEQMDTYSFVSAGEGWTPFGIHNDYEPSFIFHLGPGPKTAWIWPAGEPADAKITQSPALNGVSFALADYLHLANQYTLEPGDFLCIPAGLYHVFENTSPSAFLGITVFPPDPQRVLTDHLAGQLAADPRRARNGTATTAINDTTIAAFAADTEKHLANYQQQFARRLRQLRSCGSIVAPHPTVLQQLPEPDANRPFSARFDTVCQRADATSMFGLGRATHTGLPNIDTDYLCNVLNDLNNSIANDLASKLNAPTSAVADLLVRLTRLGALQQ